MNNRTIIRVGVRAGIGAFCLSFVLGLIAGSAVGFMFLRAFIFAALFALIGVLVTIVYEKYLQIPEETSEEPQEEIQEEDNSSVTVGGNFSIDIGDDEGFGKRTEEPDSSKPGLSAYQGMREEYSFTPKSNVVLEDIGGPNATMEDYAKAISTVLKRDE